MNQLSKNFTVKELRCDDNCDEAKEPEMSIVILLEMIRMYFGLTRGYRCKIMVTDGCRCYENNERIQKKWYPINNNGKEYVPGSSKSRHMKKDAADFKVFIKPVGSDKNTPWDQVDPGSVTAFLNSIFPNSLGIGTYHNRNHADTRKTKARW